MKTLRNIIAAVAAGGALSLGAAAFAQDAPKPEQPKPQAGEHMHRHGGGMQGMQGMRGRGGCHGQQSSQGEGRHNHS